MTSSTKPLYDSQRIYNSEGILRENFFSTDLTKNIKRRNITLI